MLTRYPFANLEPERKKAVAEYHARLDSGEYRLESSNCVLCGYESTQRLFSNDCAGARQDTVLCRGCGLVFLSPRLDPGSTYDFYSSDIYRRMYSTHDYLDQQRLKAEQLRRYALGEFDPDHWHKYAFVELLQREECSFESVCEIGSGTGVNLIPFERLGKRCIGYDLSPNLVGLGREFGLDMHIGSTRDVDEIHDMVLVIHVLEHFLNPLEELRAIRRIMGKYLLVEVPGMVTQVPKIQVPHNYYFSGNTLSALAALAGLRLTAFHAFPKNDFLVALFEKGDIREPNYDREEEKKRAKALVKSMKWKWRIYEAAKSVGLQSTLRYLHGLVGRGR